MSYILDALKKSDRERQHGKVPGLDSVHDRFPSTGHRSPSSLNKFIAVTVCIALLISISVAAWYWHADFFPPNNTVVITKDPISTVTPPDVTVNHQMPLVTLPVPLPKADTTELKIPAPEKKMAVLQAEEFPELHFAGHTYSDDPAKRMIIINDAILREGGKVDESITLIEITWTGVILDYNGQRIELMLE